MQPFHCDGPAAMVSICLPVINLRDISVILEGPKNNQRIKWFKGTRAVQAHLHNLAGMPILAYPDLRD